MTFDLGGTPESCSVSLLDLPWAYGSTPIRATQSWPLYSNECRQEDVLPKNPNSLGLNRLIRLSEVVTHHRDVRNVTSVTQHSDISNVTSVTQHRDISNATQRRQ